MSPRITRDEQMLMQALITSMRSTCGRKQVGAIIAKEGRIISSGYAGPPSGQPHCTPECLTQASPSGCKRTIHAEANAVSYAARHGISTQGATLYCTLSPCSECAKLIISSGVTKVWYIEKYRDDSGVKLLQESGILCEMNNALSAHLAKAHQMCASMENRSEERPTLWLSEIRPGHKTHGLGST